jgi:hypothetical protein
VTGLATTLGFETAAYFRLFSFPAGVTVSGLAFVLSLLVFFAVSLLTRTAVEDIDPDIRLVMET